MANQTTIILKEIIKIGKFRNNGRKICSFKTEHLEELLILLKSVIERERLLKKLWPRA
jgi:hypothetical protein